MTSSTDLPQKLPPARLTTVIGKRPGRLVGMFAGWLMDAVVALPPGARDGFARGIAWLAYTLGIRRRVTLDNLARALPEKSQDERERIARGAYTTMSRVVIESLNPRDHLEAGWEADEPIRGSGWPALEAAVREGRGALIATAHFGNWERTGKMLLRRGIPLNPLVRPLKGALNHRIVDNRLRAGAGLIYPKGAIQTICETLKLGESVLVLLDQAMPLKHGVFVPFMGRPASTTPALAIAAQKTGAPVFVAMAIREPGGRRMYLQVEGPLPPPAGAPDAETLVAHTALVTAELERIIREHPEQWLWLHRRWKVQPPTPPKEA